MSASSLERLGGIIKQIAPRSDNKEIRSWAFVCYLAAHPEKLLEASPPPEIAEQVYLLLDKSQLPIVELKLIPPEKNSGPPQKTIPFPKVLFQKYVHSSKFLGISRVQVRRSDGKVIDGILIDSESSLEFMFDADTEMSPEEIIAIRSLPGCLFGWLIKPKWITK